MSRVVAADKLLDEAIGAAEAIASYSLPVVMMIKESINTAYETTLAEGVHFERRVFHSTFATGRPEGRYGSLPGKAQPELQASLKLDREYPRSSLGYSFQLAGETFSMDSMVWLFPREGCHDFMTNVLPSCGIRPTIRPSQHEAQRQSQQRRGLRGWQDGGWCCEARLTEAKKMLRTC